MKYQKLKKYKYILSEDEIIQTTLQGYEFKHEFFTLDTTGLLTIFTHYKWDGLSGPTWDTDNTQIPSLGHDALYQAIRLGLLPLKLKNMIDNFFYTELLRYGVNRFRAKYFYVFVDIFGHRSCKPGDIKIPEVLEV